MPLYRHFKASRFPLSLLLPTLLFFTPAHSAFTRQTPAQQFALGQSTVNELRHSVAVSNLPATFGKFGHILLSRNVVSPSKIWSRIDPFTREVLKDLNRLDRVVATVDARNSIVIQAGFSCLDSGSSTAFPLTWWASETLGPLANNSNGPGGAIIQVQSPDAAVNDITDQCLQARRDQFNLRLVEHRGQHDGEGVVFKDEYDKFGSILDNVAIFDEIRKQREAISPSNDVIYEQGSKIPIVIGITFDTGIRVMVPQSFTNQRTLKLRVPMTPLAAITKHGGAFLEESTASPSVPRTTTALLVLNVISTGLAILVGVWIICKHVSDTKKSRSDALLQQQDTELVVQGGDGWSIAEKATFMVYLITVTILAAPFALVIVEGKLSGAPSVEVSTGASVLYGSSNSNLSGAPNNPVAGAPFQVTVWMSVRRLDDGHYVALAFSSSRRDKALRKELHVISRNMLEQENSRDLLRSLALFTTVKVVDLVLCWATPSSN